ncbi:BTB/POZ domain-containing protein [Phytophthora infestans]|uniref:BTB/POZ domain-containing protein n=1 Tax=Phytophthora infestans TaxID=4787 RepID=A0A8S9UPF1_PHYIN|nr:BTB/POZ domain-containing protein [Phytophthora infestans]
MASSRFTAEHDELLLSVAGRHGTWPERMQAFTDELRKRSDFLPMPTPAFTLREVQSHLLKLCENVPTGPVKSLSSGWYPKRTELLQTIARNTRGVSHQVKTVLFNHAVKEKGWSFTATLEQVKWKLERLSGNSQHSAAADVPIQSSSSSQKPGTKRSNANKTGTWATSKRQKAANDDFTEGDRSATSSYSSASDDAENDTSDNGFEGENIGDGSVVEHIEGGGSPSEEPAPPPASEVEEKRSHNQKETASSRGETMAAHLRSLVNNKLMSDVVFVVEGSEIFAHKCICIRNPYFKTFLSSENRVLRVRIPNVSRATFLVLIEYVYTDQGNVPRENVTELFAAADRLGIQGLKRQCSKILLESLSIDNAANMLLAAIQHDDPVLRDACFTFTLRNLEKVSKTKSFIEMAKRDPEMVVQIVQKVSTMVNFT